MPRASADFKRLLQALAGAEVEFIVVGGVAAVIHGAPVTTFDLDIVPALSQRNVGALRDVLEQLAAVYRERPELRPTAEQLASRGHKLLLTDAGPLDVLGAIGEGLGFDELCAEASVIEVWGVKLRVLSLEALIRIKEQLGHDKDLAVLPVLRRTLRERRQ